MLNRRTLLTTAAAVSLAVACRPVAAAPTPWPVPELSHHIRLQGLPLGSEITIQLRMFGERRTWRTYFSSGEDITFDVPAIDPQAVVVLKTVLPDGDVFHTPIMPSQETKNAETGEIRLIYWKA